MYASYYKIWKLEIKSSKIIFLNFFSKGRLPNCVFTIDGISLEVVIEYKYLGVRLVSAYEKHIAKQATKAMFNLLRKARSLHDSKKFN